MLPHFKPKHWIIALMLLWACFPLSSSAQQTIQIGADDIQSEYVPVKRDAEYSRCMMIYNDEDFGSSYGEVSSLGFYLNQGTIGTPDWENISWIRVYMGHIGVSDFSIEQDWLAATPDVIMVYEGEMDIPLTQPDWSMLKLQTPFSYDGGDLLVAIEYVKSYGPGDQIFWNIDDNEGESLCVWESSEEGFPGTLGNPSGRPWAKFLFDIPSIALGADIFTNEYATPLIHPGAGLVVRGVNPPSSYYWTPEELVDDPYDTNTIFTGSISVDPTTLNLAAMVEGGTDADQVLILSPEENPEYYYTHRNRVYYVNAVEGGEGFAGYFYSSNGPLGGYNWQENYQVTFYPCDANSKLRFTFQDFDVDCSDYLKAYYGTAPQVDSLINAYPYCGTDISPTTLESRYGQPLTFAFYSDDAITGDGWVASIQCVPKPNCSQVAGTASLSVNGLCCDLELSLSGNTGTFSHWEEANIACAYSNIGGPQTKTITNELEAKKYRAYVTDQYGTGCYTNEVISTGIYNLDQITLYPDKDAMVFDYYEYMDNNYGTYPYFRSAAWTHGGTPTKARGLIKFDLDTLPPGVAIASAKLNLYAGTHYPYTQPNNSYLYRVLQPWEENTVTWNTQPLTDNTNQVYLPGTTLGVQDTITNYECDVTELVSNWINGSLDNNGLMLRLANEVHYAQMEFASSDNANVSKHPKLTITYTSLYGKAQISSTGNNCTPGSVTLSITQQVGACWTFVEWQKSVIDQSNFVSIGGPATKSYNVNTTTYFRAVIDTGDGLYYTNVVSYKTGNKYYVNDNSLANDTWCTAVGNDANNGFTPATPKASIGALLSAYGSSLKACDIIYVDAGAYTEEVVVGLSGHENGTNYLQIMGAGDSLTIINAPAAQNNFTLEGTAYIAIEDMEMVGNGNYNVYINQSSDIAIKNCKLSGAQNTNIYIDGVSANSDRVAIQNNTIINDLLTSYPAIGAYGTCDELDISGNNIQEGMVAITLDESTNSSIYNNFIYNSRWGLRVGSSNATNNNLHFNSFYNTDNNVEFSQGDAIQGWDMRNNIFHLTSESASDYCLLFDTETQQQFDSCDYNIYYAPDAGGIAKVGVNTYQSLVEWYEYPHANAAGDLHSLQADPGYISPATGDLNIDVFSVGFEAGEYIPYILTDRNGLTRSFPPSIGGSAGTVTEVNPYYATLSKKLDGSYQIVTDGILRFKYTEEYNQPAGAVLKFIIYNQDHEPVVVYNLAPGNQLNRGVVYGNNFYAWNISDYNAVHLDNKHYYILEVANDKNESWFLRFKPHFPYHGILDAPVDAMQYAPMPPLPPFQSFP